ncbi:MAG: HEPN domain-containing protein [Caldilineaceae bacterium]|nr:HEPN domain-containing protein [Caldilineaceae bacterium]
MTGAELVVQEARRWLQFSAEDLDVARRLLTDRLSAPRHVRWLSQQAAEKALKAALVLEEIDFPYTHDLNVLRNLLPDSWILQADHSELADLTEWAVEARYPGEWPEATETDAIRAEVQASLVLDSVVLEFRRRGLQVDEGAQ